MSKRIAILTSNPFPIGNVATNRFTTYAKAFINKGVFTKIFILKATEIKGQILNIKTKGIFSGIEYQYMSNTTIWNIHNNIIQKILLYIYGIILASINIRKDKINTIILYTNDPIYMLYFGIYSKIFSIKYIIDKSEYPIVHYKKKSIYKTIYLNLYKLFDGIIVMTKELEKYYLKLLKKNSNCIYLPMTVDLSRFDNIEKETSNPPYICCVFGSHNRDCIIDTIKAFNTFKKSHCSNIQLKLIGDLEKLTDKDIIHKYINLNAFEICKDIIFTGVIDSNLIPKILINSDCLITTPRNYSSGGFPSKLGEYLATGNPVLANDVGEINVFLQNKTDILLSNPGDIEQIANNMYFVFNNYDKAQNIGKNGRKIAYKYFDAEIYIEEILKFIN